MAAIVNTRKKASNNNYLLLISALAITCFLFFIDEGYYNFNWMTEWGNWIPFVVYTVVIFISQLVVFRCLKLYLILSVALAISVPVGGLIGVLILVSLIF